jgi:glycolate oxidase subunit GlcD
VTALSANSDGLAARLAAIVGGGRVLGRRSELLAYASDGLPSYHVTPGLAVFPGTSDEVVAVVRELASRGVPFVPRGAGTGLSGGALADGVVLLGLNRLKRIIAVHPEDRIAVVEPGVVNVALSRAVAAHGLHYAPDPSSQAACTIGGNVAENAGGPHCLKYGVTTNHVVALTVLQPDGRIVALGNPAGESAGYDIVGAFVGSEGCFGVVLDATVRLTPNPEAVRTLLADFTSLNAAAQAVSGVIASGIVPAALEMMDRATIAAVESSIYAAGYPVDAEAVLLIELDGAAAGLERDVNRVADLCREAGARSVRIAQNEAERVRLWQGRKKAFGAMGRVSSHLVVQDAVVPRTKLPMVLERIQQIARAHAVHVCNVFHAGDGNLHPNIPYDADDPAESERVHAAMREILLACIEAGGTITGEHGVGLDKLAYMDELFSPESLAVMCDLRQVFDPERRCNPAKVVPVHSCREWHGTPATRQADLGPAPRPVAEPTRAQAAAPARHSRHHTREEVRELAARITAAAGSGQGLRIAGRGTWLDAGRPVSDARLLSTLALTGIREYVPGDLTLTAGAGTPLSVIQAAAAEHGQWFACDPLGSSDGTLGATIATASYGPLATHYGTPRDLVLGIEFVTGAGTVARAGGRVVKNVAGYDITRLMIGAWGTLGVVTEVAIRLHARPEVERTLAIPMESEDVTRASEFLARAPFMPLAFEILNDAAADALGIGRQITALLRLGGNPEAVDAQVAACGALRPHHEVDPAVWDRLRGLGVSASASARFADVRSRFGSLWTDCARSAPRGALLFGMPARGVIRCAVPSSPETRDAARLADMGEGFQCANVVWEMLPPAAWSRITDRGDADRIAQALRHRFDPSGVLNPGILPA